jgi:hypothetical protein
MALCSGAVAHAQQRPSETDMFGSPASSPAPETASEPKASEGAAGAPQPATGAGPAPNERDGLILDGAASSPAVLSPQPAPDPLTIGGQMYVRAQAAALQNQQIEDYTFSVPMLLDLYVDVRPNDRVRGFALARMAYDPMLPDPIAGVPGSAVQNGGTAAGGASFVGLFGTRNNAPRVQLDQFWLRFDLWRTLFVTIGRQHVHWGTAHFWSPTDFLHVQRRNPLDTFDARPGTDMLKLHLPIESTNWNFYAYAIAGGYNDTPTLYSVSGAARAEFVAGSNELGLGAVVRRGAQPRFAADLSTSISVLDLYGEAALLDVREIDRVRYDADAVLPDPPPATGSVADQTAARIEQAVDTYYPAYRDHGYKPQIVGGLTYTQKYNDNDTFTIGLEYFYNGLGYSDWLVYPGLFFPRTTPLHNPASFFYLGQHYASIYLLFPSPFSLDLHSFSLSSIANLSDRSFVTRLDYSVFLLTHLRFEAWLAAFYGRHDGEFRFGIEIPNIDDLMLSRRPATFTVGIAFRLQM